MYLLQKKKIDKREDGRSRRNKFEGAKKIPRNNNNNLKKKWCT